MSLTVTPLPYGLRDIKLKSFTDAAATALSATPIELPYARTLSFSEAEEFEELRGDDTVVTTRGSGPSIEWELESGGLPIEAVQAMYGGTITSTGTAPAQKKQYRKLATDTRPFFFCEGQAMSDSGGDVHGVVHKCRASGNLEGELADATFWLTGASGVGLPSTVASTVGALYDFVQNETAVTIT